MKLSIISKIIKGLIVTGIDDLRMLHYRGATTFDAKAPDHYLGYVLENKRPIILLSGIHSHWSKLKKIGNHLSLNGHPLYVIDKLGKNIIDIPSLAKIVSDFVEENKIKGAIILAHSKGGLIGKYFLIHHNKDHRVTGMVAVASPFSGTAVVRLLRRIPRLKELDVDSEILLDMQKHAEVNKQIVSVYPHDDPVIWSEQGSFLAGAKENIEVKAHGHHSLFYTKHGREQILRAIEILSQ